MRLRLLRDIPKMNLRGKRVLLRVDYEIPVKAGEIIDDFRIRATVPTLQYLERIGAAVLLLTKRGHFEVRRTPRMSTRVFISPLEHLLRRRVQFLKDFQALARFAKARSGLYLFENLRFWKEEMKNDHAFAQRFAAVADLYVSDNFGTAHRAQATVAILPKLLPSYTGFLVEREVGSLGRIVQNPKRPVAAIMGGAKLETKLPLIRRFLRLGADVLVGGALTNERLPTHPKIHRTLDGPRYRGNFIDAGPRTMTAFAPILRRARTIFWNGPLGVIENPAYTKGTIALVKVLRHCKAFKVVGGGDTVPFLQKHRALGTFDHVSTGGGAMLEFLAGKKLPGIEVLRK